MKLLFRLRVGFTQLKEHKFRRNSEDAVNPLCCCGNFFESTAYFILHCTHFSNQIMTFFHCTHFSNQRLIFFTVLTFPTRYDAQQNQRLWPAYF